MQSADTEIHVGNQIVVAHDVRSSQSRDPWPLVTECTSVPFSSLWLVHNTRRASLYFRTKCNINRMKESMLRHNHISTEENSYVEEVPRCNPSLTHKRVILNEVVFSQLGANAGTVNASCGNMAVWKLMHRQITVYHLIFTLTFSVVLAYRVKMILRYNSRTPHQNDQKSTEE